MILAQLVDQRLKLFELVVMTKAEVPRPIPLTVKPELALQRDDGAGEFSRDKKRGSKRHGDGTHKKQK